jgi:DNA processing protein
MALEQDRQVFAVPGSPLTGKTRGSNRLLREGARLVECVEDVIEELAPQLGGARLQYPATLSGLGANQLTDDDQQAAAESEEAKSVLMYLKNADKLHVDSIIEGSGLNAQTVLKLLLELELRGLVMQHPGKLFSRA